MVTSIPINGGDKAVAGQESEAFVSINEAGLE